MKDNCRQNRQEIIKAIEEVALINKLNQQEVDSVVLLLDYKQSLSKADKEIYDKYLETEGDRYLLKMLHSELNEDEKKMLMKKIEKSDFLSRKEIRISARLQIYLSLVAYNENKKVSQLIRELLIEGIEKRL